MSQSPLSILRDISSFARYDRMLIFDIGTPCCPTTTLPMSLLLLSRKDLCLSADTARGIGSTHWGISWNPSRRQCVWRQHDIAHGGCFRICHRPLLRNASGPSQIYQEIDLDRFCFVAVSAAALNQSEPMTRSYWSDFALLREVDRAVDVSSLLRWRNTLLLNWKVGPMARTWLPRCQRPISPLTEKT